MVVNQQKLTFYIDSDQLSKTIDLNGNLLTFAKELKALLLV